MAVSALPFVKRTWRQFMTRQRIVSEDVLEQERLSLGEKASYTGLALSGGGIRSAAFGMGVLQALAKSKVLEKVDYMSTVSGGGFLGSSLTWFLSRKNPDGDHDYNTSDHFPFPEESIASDHTPLQFIRQHCKYPTPDVDGLDFVSFLAVIFRGMITSLFVYMSLLVCIYYVCFVLVSKVSGYFSMAFEGPNILLSYIFLFISISCAVWFFIQSLIFDVHTQKSSDPSVKRYENRTRMQAKLGRIITTCLVFLLLGSFPLVHKYFFGVYTHSAMGFVSIFTGVLAGSREFKRSGIGSRPGQSSNILVVGLAVVFIYGILSVSYAIANQFFLLGWAGGFVISLLFLLAGVVGWMANLNYSSLNRMYRDRLMEAFLPDVENVKRNRWGYSVRANKANISEMCQTSAGKINRPYHLLNTNIVLTGSENPKYRGRQGDSFLISPKFVGSDATGYTASNTYMEKRGGITLATAMSISGGAVNPNSGRGPTADRFVSTLLSLLNLRMGFWATNPAKNNDRSVPNYIVPGFAGGILTTNALTEECPFVELSDGGHFENLGLYELFRRELGLIIVTDASQDAEFQFSDLANALELAKTDFGVSVDFKGSLNNILPDSSTEDKLAVEKYHFAKQGHAVADITYRNGRSGKLIYLKTTLVPLVPAEVLGYKNDHPAFPDETTVDQFFNEAQFEAYRQLGLSITKSMLEDDIVKAFNQSNHQSDKAKSSV